MIDLYRDQSYNARRNAQWNLDSRTSYANAENLRFHHARILRSEAIHNGLTFYLIESVAADMDNTRRVFRFVVFDIYGNVVERADLEDSFKTRKQAEQGLAEFLQDYDAIAVTERAIDNQENHYRREITYAREDFSRMLKLEGVD